MTTTNTPSGVHVSGAPLSTPITREEAPGLLTNHIDNRLVRVRPIATPIDQISRCGGSKSCTSMKVDYYAIDSKDVSAVATNLTFNAGVADRPATMAFNTNNAGIFEVSDTVMAEGIEIVNPTTNKPEPAVGYVETIFNNRVTCVLVNALDQDGNNYTDITLPTGPTITRVVRMGRAAGELDVQTPQFASLPVRRSNYCQIFKMQVEESILHKIQSKEVGLEFSDHEAAAVADLRMGMEKNFLFGRRAVLRGNGLSPTYLTGGIWTQTDHEVQYDRNELTENTLIDICRAAFTGPNSGSNRKILVAGTDLVNAMARIERQKLVYSAETYVKWGLTFNQIVSNFGTLYVIRSEVFDQCGHSYDGMVIDPEYITKYVHMPFQAEELNLRSSGVRNTKAVVITEASCLVLRHPNAHLRVVGVSPTDENTENEFNPGILV